MTDTATTPKHTNQLIHETSPYLLQHAHNPVQWYAWSSETLTRAREEDKLILLSIGYSACHWCHVMERESFEDEAIASIMNENFVNVKVDREERPDLDDIYMAATVAMNQGQGGWPMTVFLTPQLEPVFAGTYFPPDDRHGRPGFPRLLREIARAWNEDRDHVRSRAHEFTQQLRVHRRLGATEAAGEEQLKRGVEQYAAEFDERDGGFGSAPKFPPSTGLMFLLRQYKRFDDPQALLMVRTTLDGMANGGMYDHVGGGFARYSTDSHWLVPHFEKMLYDNALLARTYLETYQVTHDEHYRRVATETLDYVLRDMTSPEGGFYSSTDADSDGEEGKFFVWEPEEIEAAVGEDDARPFNTYYDITARGNWEGKSIPNVRRPIVDVAKQLGLDPEDLRSRLSATKAKVYAVRERRVKPGLDDKVLTTWNGLMIGAFAEGYRILGDARYETAARRAADFALSSHTTEAGRLLRTSRKGKAHLDGYLEDYACLIEGLIDLYEAAGDAKYLAESKRLADQMIADFGDPDDGAFYNTALDHEELIMRYRDGADGATPSANATAASVLARLSFHFADDGYLEAATRAITAYGEAIDRFPRGFAKSLMVVDMLLDGPVELAFIGRSGSDDLRALVSEAAKIFVPNRIQALFDPASGPSDLPLLQGKQLVNGGAALYVCRDFACEVPVVDPLLVRSALAKGVAGHKIDRAVGTRRPGVASVAGTKRYAGRFPSPFADFGVTGFAVSKTGFGGYRVNDADEVFHEALTRALLCGINLIDTSTNYGDGGSERLIGKTLGELIATGELRRDEVVIVTKIGYLQGSNYERAEERALAGSGFAEIVKVSDGLWHCMHPDFLDDQLQRSLSRLQLEAVDVLLLHNPEYYLETAARDGISIDDARTEFDRRIRAAFAFLEQEVQNSRIQYYGVSSNTMVLPSTAADATSVDRLVGLAREVGGDDHHFRAVQFPLNVIESDGATRGALQSAKDAGLATLVNRPLDAIVDGATVRLADPPSVEVGGDIDALIGQLNQHEAEFRKDIAPEIVVSEQATNPRSYFGWGQQLEAVKDRPMNLDQWSGIEQQARYSVGRLAQVLDRTLSGETAERWRGWSDGYADVLDALLNSFRGRAVAITRQLTDAVESAIDPYLPDTLRSQPLARKALAVLTSTPGVTSVLVGMRRPAYVDDALAVVEWPPLERVGDIYEAVAAAHLPSSTQG